MLSTGLKSQLCDLLSSNKVMVARWEGVEGKGEKGEGIKKYKLAVIKTVVGV